MQPVVVAVQASILSDKIVKLVFTVIVHVTPPTHVAASRITASPDPGTDAPVAPPVVVDHIAVLDASQVQAAVQTAKRLAASAADGAIRHSEKGRKSEEVFHGCAVT